MSRPLPRLARALVTAAALAVILAGLYALSPYAVEYAIESGCSLTKPDPGCLGRMRAMGDAWSFKGKPARAQLWYERAAAAGDVPAMFQLGWIYEMRALDRLRALIGEQRQVVDRAGPAPAAAPLPSASGVTRLDPALAERLMSGRPPEPAARRDPAMAQLLDGFAQMLADGRQSAEWYRRAADQGFGAAMNNLGELYFNGLTGRADRGEALRWYRAAAAAGNPVALWNVGTAYANGLGVARDPLEARKWATWYPNPKGAGNPAELSDAVLLRTTLFGQSLSGEQRAGLRAAVKAGTPFSITLPPS